MERPSFSSVADQVAEALIEGIRQGRWSGEMPGRVALGRELGVNHKTVEAALKSLEQSGWLESCGAGRGRRITRREAASPKALRIVILAYERSDMAQQVMLNLLHRLQLAGHLASFAETTLQQLGMSLERVARFVEKIEADGWIVVSGPNKILEWFAARPVPTFALYSRLVPVKIAATGPDKSSAKHELIARLIALGHRRIVLLAREERRKPAPGILEQAFLDQLEAGDIKTSAYNLPDWGDTPDELHRILNTLFRHTPPTALIIDDIALFFATMQHLAGIGIAAPANVSLACTDSDPNFEWCRPAITHIVWDHDPVIKRVVKWADNVSRGKDDRRVSSATARLVIGGTIGPVPRAR